MISDAIEFIRTEIRDYLGIANDEVLADSARKLIQDNNAQGAYITLINVQEEATLRNLPHSERRMGQTQYLEPPVYINLYLLFAFEFSKYETSLLHLSKTIELFQNKRWFAAETQTGLGANAFPNTLEKLTFEMVNMGFEELNNLWGILGDAYFPSVVYKVRMVKVQRDVVSPAPEISNVEVNMKILNAPISS